MPELPEVETVKLGLQSLIIGKTVKSVDHDWAKSFPNDPGIVKQYLIGSQITAIKRRAKVLIIDLSSGYSLVIHLKMTGQLVFRSENQHFGAGHPSDSLVGKLPDNSTRVIMVFSDDSTLFFNDQRKFGWMRLVKTEEILNISLLSSFGPEPLDRGFSWQVFKDRLQLRYKSAIKAVLLDQKILAGVGNIYADESLWAAKIHPSTPVAKLGDTEIKLLHKSLIDILKLAIKTGGSSDRNYVNAKGQKGSYIKFAQVFRREGQPCYRCGHEILKIRVAGRGTHYCPYCQKLK
ncbi:MAG TPA: bifunctional DNA-formamidopyrimidine glycosylase/DNA-(apurinic or apyrimidinic site) lyase [Candidatus Saccharimonadales bacterium]|jgi:formamidopyrimidine-DNA glycosylase